MNLPATCKICGKPLVLQIDDDYKHDIWKLIPMATCNRCYDLRDEQIRIETGISKTCTNLDRILHNLGEKPMPDKVLANFNASLTALTRKYADWLQKKEGISGYIWDKTLVDLLLEKPMNYPKVLGEYRRGIVRLGSQPNRSAQRDPYPD